MVNAAIDPYLADLLKAVLLGIVEGLTEFLPISSTGHLILAGHLLNFDGPLAFTFEIFIQLGAVLAVVWLFRADLWRRLTHLRTSAAERRFALSLLLAFLPAAIVGLLAADWIEAHLFQPLPVALAQIAGALLIFAAEWRHHLARTTELDEVSRPQALGVGVAQIAALWPGASRAASTMVGGMFVGLDRVTSTRFSFYLAIPTLGLASLYALAKHAADITPPDALLLVVGFVVSFAVAFVVIRWLLGYVSGHSLRIFAWYRLVLGALVLLALAMGWMQP
jgi:undecaprenyl-diphosphatase